VAAACDYVMDGINVKQLYCYSNSDNFVYTNCTCHILKSIVYSEQGMVKELRLAGRCMTSHFSTLPTLQMELSHKGSQLKIQ
jgi:hypothetical protein